MIEAQAFVPWREGDALTLRDGELHLWALPVDRVSESDWLLLTPEERAKAERIRIESKKVQKASARAGLRRLLGAYLEQDPATVRFCYGEHDKPDLADGGVSFNLSHSGAWALVGVQQSGVVGVDVEKAERIREFTLIAERFFSQVEREYLGSLPEAEHGSAFYRAWTRKEAYLKAWGTGLTFASSDFSIDYAPGQAGRVLDTKMPGDELGRWNFVDIVMAPDYPAAVCTDLAPTATRCFLLQA